MTATPRRLGERRVDCVILGGGGHARVLVDCLSIARPDLALAVLDPKRSLWGTSVLGAPVLGGDELLGELADGGAAVFVVGLGGTGDNGPRRRLFEGGLAAGLVPLSVRHPTAVVSSNAILGAGDQLLALSVVNAAAVLGDDVIVNTAAVVEHDCTVGSHVHVATGARLLSGVRVGDGAHIGAGAVVRQLVAIGERAVIGAGAVVVRDVPADAVVVGVPARPLVARGGGDHAS